MKIYSSINSERLIYVLDEIFVNILRLDYQLVNNTNEIDKKETFINYSDEKLPNSFQIVPVGLLSENFISNQKIVAGNYKDIPVIFYTGKGDLPFDFFAATFYLLSRYEEYLNGEPDIHGRFQAENSISWKYEFHKLPVVEVWTKMFADQLKINYPSDIYQNLLTIDIDNAWRYKHKGFFRIFGGLILCLFTGKFSEFKLRINILRGKIKDPAETYDYLDEIQNKIKLPIQYFILVGRKRKFDNALSVGNKAYQNLLLKLYKHNKVGLHPSYHSNSDFAVLTDEYYKLCSVFTKRIVRSRQHYLKFNFPETFQNLIKLSIREDYSMGWSSTTGFRAGISRPFKFFDLSKNKRTHLVLTPFALMDRTLKDYMELTPEEAIIEIKSLADSVKSIGGQFVMLWHNDSLSDVGEWQGWKKVFEEAIEYAERN